MTNENRLVTKTKGYLSTAALAAALAFTPFAAQAQGAQPQDSATITSEGNSDRDNAALTAVAVVGGGAALAATADRSATFYKSKSAATVKKPLSPAMAELERRGQVARQARTGNVVNSSNLNELARRGDVARNARPTIGSGANLDELTRRGNVARNARPAIGSGANLDDLARRGNLARDARAGKIGNAANIDELGRRGRIAQTARPGAAKVPTQRALNGNLLQKAGPNGVSDLVRRGDMAQVARGRIGNEGQLIRQIDSASDVSKLNKAGRGAQAARGAGGLKAASTATDAAKAAKAAKLAKAAKVAKMAKTGATAGKVGKAGRAAVAGTGVGLIAIGAEIAFVQGMKASTGAEIQDPISTGFQYGAAVFDKDISIGDVAEARWDHHKENFQSIGETFTEKGRYKENLTNYGKGVAETAVKVNDFGKKTGATARKGLGAVTGAEFDSIGSTQKKYGSALTSDKPIANTGRVMADRTKHHAQNAGKVAAKKACQAANLLRFKKNRKKC